MNALLRLPLAAALLGACLFLTGCQTAPAAEPGAKPAAAAPVVRNTAATPIDRAVEDRILALDPEAVTGRDVRATLQHGPVPKNTLLHGGPYGVHLLMESFAEFLSELGYPNERTRDAG